MLTRLCSFPALVNCVVIDWFQPWPEEALASVSKRFLDPIDLGSEEQKLSVIGFMPYSFLAVEKESAACTINGAVQFGRMVLNISLILLAPATRAAVT